MVKLIQQFHLLKITFEVIRSNLELIVDDSSLRQPLQTSSICITGVGREQAGGCTREHYNHSWHALSTQSEVFQIDNLILAI